MRIFSRKNTNGRIQQLGRRLAEIESTYESVTDADPAETLERLLRMRYGTPSGTPRSAEN